MTDLAAAWLAENHPDALDDFPSPDTGRTAGRVELSEPGYWETTGTRPGTRRNPGWRRAEALESYDPATEAAWQADARRLGRLRALCEHCGITRRRSAGSAHCDACYRYQLRNGKLPEIDRLDARQSAHVTRAA